MPGLSPPVLLASGSPSGVQPQLTPSLLTSAPTNRKFPDVTLPQIRYLLCTLLQVGRQTVKQGLKVVAWIRRHNKIAKFFHQKRRDKLMQQTS